MTYPDAVTTQKGAYEYVEMQSTEENYREDYGNASLGSRIFSVFILPLLLLALLLSVYKRMMRPAVSAAAENTKVIAENNELLRETIALQREILQTMRKSGAEE